MEIRPDNSAPLIYDYPFSLKCPHCGVVSNISALALPDYNYGMRFQPQVVGLAYFCNNCKFPVFLRFKAHYDPGNGRISLNRKSMEEVERSQETFEYQYLPDLVATDFREALTCYSHTCYQAFAAMCRRTAQSAFEQLGAAGKDRVMDQLKEIRETAHLDDETFEILKQIVVQGHDGAPPHLPRLDAQRAGVLLELMKDVLYQLFVRQAKIQEAIALRQQAIEQNKQD
jgi:hypothetical protein